jgi:2-amino-4-hydroxy-6-hydroxymethyldihydropteridine diphosphokinase
MVDKIFLALGSNLGDRYNYLKFAVQQFRGNDKCRVLKSSAVYETKPLGNVAQENFYNAVIEIETALGFFELFYLTKSIETKAGRNANSIKHSPRELDIDIIFYNELIYNGEVLNIPHSDYANRDFVLQPLLEIVGDFKHPIIRKKMQDIQFNIPEKYIIQKIADSLF